MMRKILLILLHFNSAILHSKTLNTVSTNLIKWELLLILHMQAQKDALSAVIDIRKQIDGI